MSGGGMDYFYSRVSGLAVQLASDDLFDATTDARAQFREHLRGVSEQLKLVAAALKAIEWSDSGDRVSAGEDEAIKACLQLATPYVAPEFRQGDVVRYIPLHAHGNASHPDSETGTVSSFVNGEYVFVRFGAGDQSAACKPEQLMLVRRP